MANRLRCSNMDEIISWMEKEVGKEVYSVELRQDGFAVFDDDDDIEFEYEIITVKAYGGHIYDVYYDYGADKVFEIEERKWKE